MTKSSFRPPRWLQNPHLQTIAAAAPLFAPRPIDLRDQEACRIPLGEDSFLHARITWATAERAPLVIALHGIGGSKDSHCCTRAALAIQRFGLHAAVLDMRGAGDSVVDAPSLYHAGLTTDLDLAIRHFACHPRVSGVFVLGFSGGGSQALKLAGEWGDAVPAGLLGIATISAPLDYTRVSVHMDSLRRFPYRRYVLAGLIERARRFAEHHPTRAHYGLRDLESIKRFRAFDASVIVPMHGFTDVDTYYREASAGHYLGRIRVPTTLIHAEDDPMVPFATTVRPWLDRASPHVRLRSSKNGGHLGWLGGLDEAGWVHTYPVSEALRFFGEVAASSVASTETRRAGAA